MEREYFNRAMAAWFRAGNTDQPSSYSSGMEEVKGLNYVVLRNVNGILAVYRIKPDGFLRRMRRWPKELDRR